MSYKENQPTQPKWWKSDSLSRLFTYLNSLPTFSHSPTHSNMVDINPFYNLQNLEDQHSYQSFYNNLPAHPFQQQQDENQVRQLVPRQPLKRFMLVFSSGILLLVSLVALLGDPKSNYQIRNGKSSHSSSSKNLFVSTGVKEGVSDKAVQLDGVSFPWTKAMLAWQRTAFHFQPTKNWMNDPDGPLFHMGWYHLFYQYNPDEAIWGNITWGHAVSKDLIHWLYLPLALEATAWYDSNGTWTGSATLLPNGNIVMIYTGSTNEGVQVQNVAFPANLSDPLLLDWVKYSGNPVIVPPPGIGLQDFRDPTTAWYVGDKWHVGIGSTIGLTGIAFVYETTDFLNYTLLDGVLHAVPTTGMWECIDFYPISTTSDIGLDTSFNGPDIKHLLKASLNDDKHDYYALGTYYAMNNTWIPDDPELDVGIGIRYDYGKFYASKTFYDQNTGRRLLWGWIGETDSQDDDIEKDWAGLQSIPRVVVFDMKTKSNILLWPIEEVESLRLDSKEFNNIEIEVGSVIPLHIGSATQLDITAEFEIASEALEETIEADVLYNCSTSGGAAGRGVLGPFGLLVISDKTLSEQTAVYFYIAKAADGDYKTYFCTDGLRSSSAEDALKRVYGSYVPVLDGEKLTVRILVDHSIVEAFAQGGRTCITSRVYPTEAIYGAAGLFLFNNATGINVTLTSLTVWQMDSAFIHSYPL